MLSQFRKHLKSGSIVIRGFELSWQLKRNHEYRNGHVWRLRDRTHALKLHLGPGPQWRKPDDSWLNVDIDPKRADIVVNFNRFDHLPLPERSVACIYASHTLEHISIYRIDRLIQELHRVLTPGGIFRIVVPDARKSIEEYLSGNAQFPLFMRRAERAKRLSGQEWTLFECMKGDFISRNGQPHLLGENLAHQNAWDFDAMRAMLCRGGFPMGGISRQDFQVSQSAFFEFEGTYPSEANERDRSMYVEAIKSQP